MTGHLRVAVSWVYLRTLTSFSEHFIESASLGNCLFNEQVAEFHPADPVKSISQVLFKYFIQEWELTIWRPSFIQNPWKLSVKKLIGKEVARCQSANLRKKLFHTSSFIYFAFIFSELITITSFEKTFKMCEHNIFQEI